MARQGKSDMAIQAYYQPEAIFETVVQCPEHTPYTGSCQSLARCLPCRVEVFYRGT